MTDIGALCKKLQAMIEWQKLPVNTSAAEIEVMINDAIIEGIEDLFVVTGRANMYENYSQTYDDGVASEFSYDLRLDERMYVMCYAQIAVYSKVRTQYTELLGYTTNALTVTNADKPYAYITGTINELRGRLQLYYYKMVRFSHLD